MNSVSIKQPIRNKRELLAYLKEVPFSDFSIHELDKSSSRNGITQAINKVVSKNGFYTTIIVLTRKENE
jgi:hypothetical protein